MPKTFKDNLNTTVNPAMRFISQPEAAPGATQAPRPETKSRRVQLLFRPALYGRLKAGAARQGVSVNEYVHVLLEGAIE